MWWLWDMQQMYQKYSELQKKLSKTLIRSKDWWIVIDITADTKIQDVKIEDESLLNPDNKEQLETAIKNAITKWQQKAQEVAMEKTKEVLWFDPSQLGSMLWGMWWWQWGWFPWLN